MQTLKELFISLFGIYQPVVYTASNGETVTTMDIPYIACVIAFLILLWGCIRILGNILSKR